VTPAILIDWIELIVEVERVFWSVKCVTIERGGELELMGNSRVTLYFPQADLWRHAES
jgi:hypothetical protein